MIAAKNHPESVQPLLDAKSDVNATDRYVSPLMSCEHKSSLEHAPDIHRIWYILLYVACPDVMISMLYNTGYHWMEHADDIDAYALLWYGVMRDRRTVEGPYYDIKWLWMCFIMAYTVEE